MKWRLTISQHWNREDDDYRYHEDTTMEVDSATHAGHIADALIGLMPKEDGRKKNITTAISIESVEEEENDV